VISLFTGKFLSIETTTGILSISSERCLHGQAIMPNTSLRDASFLAAALEGLEIQRARIEEQIQQVRRLLATGSGSVDGQGAAGAKKARNLSPAARRRIAEAQKKRWAEFRKKKGRSAGT
jgi:hypothetical protein